MSRRSTSWSSSAQRSTARLALAAWILTVSAVAQTLPASTLGHTPGAAESVISATAAPRTPPPPRILAPDGLFGFSRLARSAGLIFAGRVTAVVRHPTATPNGVETVAITFQVQQAIRGTSSGTQLTIQQWQGAWSAGQTYRVGENVLLFLYPLSKLGLTSVVGGHLGRFPLDPAGRILLSAEQRADFPSDPLLGGQSLITLDEMQQAVRQARADGVE
jgi:hypothetical protein